MERQVHTSHQDTITRYVKQQFKKQAVYTGTLLIIVSAIVFVASVKFSTDRYARTLCSQVNQSARMMVETSKLDTYQAYYRDIVGRLEKQLEAIDLHVADTRPALGLNHYSLGACSLHWQSDLKIAYYIPTHWAGEEVYVGGTIYPRFFRSDLIIFMFATCFALILSYFLGTRRLLLRFKKEISDPIHSLWEWCTEGKETESLRFREFRSLAHSLQRAKELEAQETRMMIAAEFTHELKSPSHYLLNQMMLINSISDPQEQSRRLALVLPEAEQIVARMNKAMHKIATNDFAHFPKPLDIDEIISKFDRNYTRQKPFIHYGDKTLVTTIFRNLYENAYRHADSLKLVTSHVADDGDFVKVAIENPLQPGAPIDMDRIFESGYTTNPEGSGIGLHLTKTIVKFQGGTLKAEHAVDKNTFRVTVSLPKAKDVACSS